MNAMLFYDDPANHWCEALPLGNGRIGAMVFGGIHHERIALNEDTLWTGKPVAHKKPGAKASFSRAQALALEGKYGEAQQELETHTLGMWSALYQPLGDLLIDMDHQGEVSEYRRVLDLGVAVHDVRYRIDNVYYRREAVVSHPGQALIVRMTGSARGVLNMRVRLANQIQGDVRIAGDSMILEGYCPSIQDVKPGEHVGLEHFRFNDPECIGYCATLRAAVEGGRITAEDDCFVIRGADAVTLYLTARTSFTRYDKAPGGIGSHHLTALHDLSRVASTNYETVLAQHMSDHQRLFGRVQLKLHGILPHKEEMTTSQRLREHNAGSYDMGLYQLLFDFGRYLLIASSREGTQPANLQGIWNEHVLPPWHSNYTVNINTQMNYWPVHGLNLLECEEPLVRMIQELTASGKETAQAWYGFRGTVCHHNTDLWRMTTPVGRDTPGAAQYACWPMAMGWFARNLWERFAYTLDYALLRETILPVLRETALFYLDGLVEDKQGKLILCPSTSPENSFLLPDGKRCAVAATTAMTMAIVREVFALYRKAVRLLALEGDALAQEIQAAEPRLMQYEIGSDGRILEWNEELPEAQLEHRHLSHLYGLYPGNEIQPNTELWEACRKSLEVRGDEGTGWSLAWKVNFQAILGEGDHALELVDKQLRLVDPQIQRGMQGGSYPNLMCAHPPFQIDGNFGVVAGILNMLVQSDENHIRFLPALPERWPDGDLAGVRVRGGKCVDFSWRNGQLLGMSIRVAEDA